MYAQHGTLNLYPDYPHSISAKPVTMMIRHAVDRYTVTAEEISEYLIDSDQIDSQR